MTNENEKQSPAMPIGLAETIPRLLHANLFCCLLLGRAPHVANMIVCLVASLASCESPELCFTTKPPGQRARLEATSDAVAV